VTATEDEGGNFSAHVLRRRILSMVCFLVCGAAVSFACLAVQRQRDWYGVFGNRDMAPFAEIPRDQLDAMLAERLPAVSDHVHRLELGSRIANARVFGDPHRFRHGMKIHALARFTYDRPRMKMAFILVAPGGAEVARQTSELEHASLYGTASFLMTPESPPGRYRVILQLDDYDAAEEWFILEGESKAVTSD